MKIYIDDDYKCHVNDPDSIYTEVEAPEQFNGKCSRYIEGYRFVPAGYTWVREDGEVFTGEMISPWRDSRMLEELQTLYDEEQAKQAALEADNADKTAALELLGVI